MTKQYDHTELLPGEEFIGNVRYNDGNLPKRIAHIPSARMGKQAYDINGKIIPTDYMRPLFIRGKKDLAEYDRVMMERLDNISKGIKNDD